MVQKIHKIYKHQDPSESPSRRVIDSDASSSEEEDSVEMSKDGGIESIFFLANPRS